MAKAGKSGKQKLRLAFIGAGGIAGTHMDALASMNDVEVVALADAANGPMADKAEKYNIPRENLFLDYKKMLRVVKPDAASVCTPNGLHAPASIAASRAGAHVFVEKPMAMNTREAKAMIDAAKQARKKLVIGFQYRFDPRTRFLIKQREEGVFGDILFGRVLALRRRGIPNWGVFGRKDLQGGGPLIDIGVHALEMCHYTMDSPKPVAAVGMARTYMGDKKAATQIVSQWPGWDHKTYTVEDLAVGHIRFANGAVIHIEAMFAGHIEKNTWDFQIMGTRGGATWADSKVFTDHNGYMMNLTPGFMPKCDFNDLFAIKNRNFIDHVLHNKPTAAPAEHGLMVQQMLDGIYESAAKGGKEVRVS